MKMPRYAVQRVRKDNTFYGPIHMSNDAETTTCGLSIDENWWILNDNFGFGAGIECKKCQKIIKNSCSHQPLSA